MRMRKRCGKMRGLVASMLLASALGMATPCRRRCVSSGVQTVLGGLGLCVWSRAPAEAAEPRCGTDVGLRSRIEAPSLSPLGASLNPLAPQETYYPDWMFGRWRVTATLLEKAYPFGKKYVPKSLVDGSPRNRQEAVGDSTTYEAKYYSTLADTMQNKATVQLGLGAPKSSIIADRAANAVSLNTAYNQLARIGGVEWDPRKDPTRLSVSFLPRTLDDMKPVGPRRVESYITARASEEYVGCDVGDGRPGFVFAEKSRSVTMEPGNVIVTDLEACSDFRLVEDGRVEGRSRTAYFLAPNPNSREGILWQEVGGKAVAFFDYKISLERMLDPAVGRPCVDTPKGYTQCY